MSALMGSALYWKQDGGDWLISSASRRLYPQFISLSFTLWNGLLLKNFMIIVLGTFPQPTLTITLLKCSTTAKLDAMEYHWFAALSQLTIFTLCTGMAPQTTIQMMWSLIHRIHILWINKLTCERTQQPPQFCFRLSIVLWKKLHCHQFSDAAMTVGFSGRVSPQNKK